ncbi:MAG TPA: helicase, partial [Candidatus Competibacteraceae bacterium]|nr:helicase [Candidatus Competibacteraceae bacterium]
MTPAAVRDRLIDALRLDLVGPALPDEQLTESPSRWYLTGFLAPLNAQAEQRSDPEAAEELDLLDTAGAAENNAGPERAAARHSPFPASLGLSVLVSADTPTLTVQLRWGDYQCLTAPPADPAAPPADRAPETPEAAPQPAISGECWQRTPRQPEPMTFDLP